MGEKTKKTKSIIESRSILFTARAADKPSLGKLENIMMKDAGVTDPTTIPNNEIIRKAVLFAAKHYKGE
jgi:hypothetical protein